ncbi:hypothetical protein [uncultured Halomonas sp.]|uniref:hypothetical protein n=1 Tax=uncultured Halomonas sp. TaxID=173971 RepID=UPI0032B1E0E2
MATLDALKQKLGRDTVRLRRRHLDRRLSHRRGVVRLSPAAILAFGDSVRGRRRRGLARHGAVIPQPRQQRARDVVPDGEQCTGQRRLRHESRSIPAPLPPTRSHPSTASAHGNHDHHQQRPDEAGTTAAGRRRNCR